ncbi:hypothetical protein ACROYT_G033364 [Oculina patagonica]
MSTNTDLNGNFSYPSNTTAGPAVEVTTHKLKSNYQVLYEVLPIAVIIIAVNSMVFYLFAKSKRLRTPTNCLLLSLAVCDFMTGFICIPLFIIVVVQVIKSPEPHAHIGHFNVIFNNCMAISAAYHILAITLERYFCISRPFAHRQLTKKSMLKLALFVWFVAAVIGFMPYAWFSLQLTDIVAYKKTQVGYVVFCLIFVFLVPSILIVFSQTVMFKAIAKSGGHRLTATKTAQRKAKNDKKCLIIFALMAFIYVVCWLPWFVLYLCFSFWFPLTPETLEGLSNLSQVVVIFRYLTSIVNPLLYTFFKKDFLQAFKLLVLRKRSSSDTRDYTLTLASRRVISANSQQRKLIHRSESIESIEQKELITVL